MIVVQCADGKGLLVSLSGADGGLAYTVEAAQPFDGSVSSPVAAGALSTRPKLVGSAAVVAGSATVLLHFDNPKSPSTPFYSDCDAGSLGVFLGTTCLDGFDKNAFLARAQYGNVWKSTQACGSTPDPTASKWTDTLVPIPPTGGDVSVTAATPTTAGDCLYFGGELNLGFPRVGTQTLGIVGTIQVKGIDPNAAPPKAENLKASNSAGKVSISWTSTNEIGLAVFKVIAVSKSKGEVELTSVSPKGNGGGASYSVSLGMGDFKGARTVIVRSILTDGSKVDSAAVNF
jgi:hypothetical protein